jgi:TPR repeat protein
MFALGACQKLPVPHVNAAPSAAAEAAAVARHRREGLRAEATAGDARAALTLGRLYEAGKEVPQDLPEALYWYQRAAMLGNPQAAFYAAVMFHSGRGTAPNHAAAARYYKQAASKGFGRAAYDLSLMLERGDGVRQDSVEARRYLEVAASRGVVEAKRRLASERQVDFDHAQAALLSQGVAAGGSGALEELEKAARGGDSNAQYNLGFFLENGIGVPVDRVQAFAWYSRAAETAQQDITKTAAQNGADRLAARLSPSEQQAADTLLQQFRGR